MRGKGCNPISSESYISALIIALMLACSISFTFIVYAIPGDLIWKKFSNPSSGGDQVWGVAVDGSSVYIVGYDVHPGDYRWRVEKRGLTSGSLTWKKTINPSTGPDVATDVAVDGTGVYIVGHDQSPGDWRWRIEKRDLTDGSLLWKKTSNPSTGGDEAHSVAVDSSGVYIVGSDLRSGNLRWRIEKRSLSDGSLLWRKTSNPSGGLDVAHGVAVDGTGVYIVGFDDKPGNYRWRVEKRDLTSGSLTWVKTSNPSIGDDKAYGVAVDGTGVYIVGYDYRPGGVDARWRVEKRDPATGSLLWKKASNPSNDPDQIYDVAVDGSGVYIAGYDSKPGNNRWRIEKRSLTDGSLTWAKTSNPSSFADVARGVAVDGTGVYIGGHDGKPGAGNLRWRIEKRHL